MPSASRLAIRNVITRVLPDPAPASTSSGPLVWLTASRCGGFSWVRSTTDGARYGSACGSSTARSPKSLVRLAGARRDDSRYARPVTRYDALVESLRAEFPQLRFVRKDR